MTSPNPLPDLPQGLTSFGAVVWEHELYIYGGHYGHAHEYYDEGQSDRFLKLNLNDPAGWEDLPGGPRLQGLAMVAFDGGIYRIGGFAARNKKGDDQDLWSSTDAARFDIAKSQWETLPPLAASRSSHDAAVWNGRIYVAGGWTLTGGKESEFHQSALVLDLDSQALDWNPLPSPPFRRRALAVGVLDDKLYVIGGMQETGEPTNQVAVFDPETDQWSEGPPLAGSPMAGFGPAATTVNGKLYVSTYDGTLQRLSPEATAWQTVHTFEQPRFFHRMLPMGEEALVLIGGANMETGKFKSLEVVPIES